jgi:hypothetical protein
MRSCNRFRRSSGLAERVILTAAAQRMRKQPILRRFPLCPLHHYWRESLDRRRPDLLHRTARFCAQDFENALDTRLPEGAEPTDKAVRHRRPVRPRPKPSTGHSVHKPIFIEGVSALNRCSAISMASRFSSRAIGAPYAGCSPAVGAWATGDARRERGWHHAGAGCVRTAGDRSGASAQFYQIGWILA